MSGETLRKDASETAPVARGDFNIDLTMAHALVLNCTVCAKVVWAWDEGNPYLIHPDGSKEYVYHPDPRRMLARGLDIDHVCLDCGHEFRLSGGVRQGNCLSCGSLNICTDRELEGRNCPWCRSGTLLDSGESVYS